jgi:Na+/H+-dicarboxylate symporter
MNKLLKKVIKLPLWQQIFAALFLGVLTGILFPSVGGALGPIGQLFINAIQLMVVPIVFISITCGVISLGSGDSHAMGRVTFKTIATYLITMAIAATIGIIVAKIMQPGQGLDLSLLNNEASQISVPQPTLQTLITSLIPSNMFAAFSNNALILQVIIIAMIMGVSIVKAGENGRRIQKIAESMFSVMMQFAHIIMRFTPVGVFALISVVVSKFGTDMLLELLTLVLTIYIGCIIQALVVYSLMLALIARLNPIHFFRGMREAMLFAFSTTSSAATLPVTLSCSQRLGVEKSISEFIIPLGASINLNGLSVYLGASAVFAANLYGIDLGYWQFAMIIFTATIASMGASGVPGSALFVMALVMTSIGIPVSVIGIIAAVDRLNDMICTATNITGDAATAVLVAESEGMLDRKIYNERIKAKELA